MCGGECAYRGRAAGAEKALGSREGGGVGRKGVPGGAWGTCQDTEWDQVKSGQADAGYCGTGGV